MEIFFSHHDYPMMRLESLRGFEEDAKAAKAFERRFQPLILASVVVMFLGFGGFGFLAFRAQERGDAAALERYTPLALGSLVSGFAVCMAQARRMTEAIPVSPRSGLPMESYRLEDTVKEGKYELVYVCRASRTYFRRVYSEESG